MTISASQFPPRELPGHYNDLDGSLAHAWSMLAQGAKDRHATFHTPVVASVDERGQPSQRVMVLRAADVSRRTLRFHTDARSAKLHHIAANPRVSVLAYDPAAKLQLRLGATARLHHADDVAAAAWDKTLPQGRLCYEQMPGSGVPIAEPLAELPADARFATGEAGAANFTVLVLTVDSVEWLYLAIAGHRRAHWCWDADRWTGGWLAP